jgi:hypothetical protein
VEGGEESPTMRKGSREPGETVDTDHGLSEV